MFQKRLVFPPQSERLSPHTLLKNDIPFISFAVITKVWLDWLLIMWLDHVLIIFLPFPSPEGRENKGECLLHDLGDFSLSLSLSSPSCIHGIYVVSAE